MNVTLCFDSLDEISSRAPVFPWLVQDLYLRESWGQPYGLAHRGPSNLRRFFVGAMVIFALVDVALALFFVGAVLFPPRRPANVTASGSPTLSGTRAPTVVARRVTDTPLPPPTIVVPPTQPPIIAVTALPPTSEPPTPEPTPIPAPAVPETVSNFSMPASLGVGALAVSMPPEPTDCTPADQMPDLIAETRKLCAGQTYRPIVMRGEGIALYGDPSATVRSEGRSFAIVAEGARITLSGLVVRGSTAPEDTGVYLCLYPDCNQRPGGIAYGGGILVRAADTTIVNSDVAGGVAGVAAERVRGLKLLNNKLDNSTGWGSYNFAVEASYFVGNSWSNANRSCTTIDGRFLPTGCESSGWLCIACQQNIVADNFCTNSGNCFYINGEGNLTSNNNRFHGNECHAAPHNCFEVTFSVGNEFVENSASADPVSGAACKYPFWVGGSSVVFARNIWQCSIGPEQALADAIDSTHIPTSIENR